MENKTIETKQLKSSHAQQVAKPGGRTPFSIPPQLRHPEFRFVLIPRGSKAPCEKQWSTIHNYRFDDPKLLKWLQQGGNYGLCCGFGELVGIDADDPIIAEVFEEHFGPTFRVRSGSGRGFHDYAIVHGLREKLLFERDGQHLGEAQSNGQQLVGPGSTHPSGGIYTVMRDLPILEIDSALFLKAFQKFLRPQVQLVSDAPVHSIALSAELQSVPLTTVISFRGTRRGQEIYGSNPWHGSTTGQNFSLNPTQNVWHCFRCNAGGGVAKAIALNEGIITRCDQSLDSNAFRRVLQIARRARVHHIQHLKGGDQMEDKFDENETVTMCPTKAGHGIKLVHAGVWFYASKRQVLEMISGRQKACTFHTIKDEPLAEVVTN